MPNREKLLARAVETIRDYAIFLLDKNGHIITWNAGAQRVKGYKEKDILGKHFSIFYPQEAKDRKFPQYELKQAKKVGRFEDEGWRVRKDGSFFWASVIITKLVDPKGKLVGFSKVTRDLSDRKFAEEKLKESELKLQKAYEDLERKVKERTATLAIANEQLKQREVELQGLLRVRDNFLSVASHELKTPITSLKLQLQILRLKLNSLSTNEESPATKLGLSIDGSLKQIDRLTVLVDDLLDVTRVHLQKLSYNFEHTDLVEIVKEAVTRLEDHAASAGCELLFDAPQSVKGNFDPFRMEQVIVNLLTNAFKYAPGKPVRISVRQENKKTARITVTDQGPGIPLAAHPKIFERFERIANSSSVAGLGLGLYIAKEIVTGHKGSIRVESELGKGASFIIDLPL